MKNYYLILLVITLFSFSQSFAQENLEVNSIGQTWSPSLETGFNLPYVVEVENKSASEIYKSAYTWVKKNFPDTEEVVMSITENELLKFQGINGSAPNQFKFMILLEFKDNRYRVTPQKNK